MYRYAKNGRDATLADLLIYAIDNYDLCIYDNNNNIINKNSTLLNTAYELAWHPNIYKNRKKTIPNKAEILLESNENTFAPYKIITYNDIMEDSSIPVNIAFGKINKNNVTNDTLDDLMSFNKYYFDYNILSNNLPIIDCLNNSSDDSFNAFKTFKYYLKYFTVKPQTNEQYSGDSVIKLSDVFLKDELLAIRILEAYQDQETAIEPYMSDDVNITWSGSVELLYINGNSSIINVEHYPYTLKDVKHMHTKVWPELAENIDINIGYDLDNEDITLLGPDNTNIDLFAEEYGYEYELLKKLVLYPTDCIYNFDEYVYKDYTGVYDKNNTKIIPGVLHLLRKANYIEDTTYYNVTMHLEIYLGGVNYNIYPTMGYGQKIGDTTNLISQNARLIPWQGETVYLLTYFTYIGETYNYKSGANTNVIFNDILNYGFNKLYHYIQDLTQVHFYASLSSQAISGASVNTPAILIPLNQENIERTVVLSAVYVYQNDKNIPSGTTASIEFKQEANPGIISSDMPITVYAISSSTNINESMKDNNPSNTIWDWSVRLRITTINPNEDDNEEDLGDTKLNDSEILEDTPKYEIQPFYVSANTTADNTVGYAAKYFCGIIRPENENDTSNENENENSNETDKRIEYPETLQFDIELNALTFSAVHNSYYFSYYTVEKDEYSKLLFNDNDTEWPIDETQAAVVGDMVKLNLTYNTKLKGYPLYIKPRVRPYKYTLNISFLKTFEDSPFYYIIKFKVLYIGSPAQIENLFEYTDILSTGTPIDYNNTENKTGNTIYDDILQSLLSNDTNKFELNSYMPIDIDNKIYFNKHISSTELMTYDYMFISNSKQLQEFKGIPIYAVYLNDSLAKNYDDFISMPKKIKILLTYEILWYLKNSNTLLDSNIYNYNNNISYSFDNVVYNDLTTNNSMIELNYINNSSEKETTPVDNITLYIKNIDIPEKRKSNDVE